MRVLIALVALLAVASAQSCPNSTAICAKARESCTASSDPNTSIQCAWGTQCIPCTTADCKATLECFPQPRLGEACSNSGPNNLRCFDPNWDITCDGGNSGVCRYKDIYGPGEGCKPTDANYVNGGCLGGITCDPSTKKCAAVKAGQPCDTNGVKDDVCEPGTYCDTDASVCAPRKALNSPCNTNYECIPTLVCTDRKVNNAPTICQEPFVGKAGDSCEDGFDCGADLLCDNDRCTAPAADGQNCGNDVSICTDAAECECDVERTNSRTTVNLVSGTCKNQFALDQYINSGSQINAFKSMQSCLQNNNCHDIWMSVGQLDLNSGPDQCIRKCLRSSFETPFDSNGRGYNTCRNSGSVIIPGAIALIALIAALLF